ncbi:hypothetical protein DFS34DRAFT_666617 [Phlyctochytrium arcticum]|nr:hypothetical protein DFS34DRAFT_666617 [Phlyctochytrium arcticum]
MAPKRGKQPGRSPSPAGSGDSFTDYDTDEEPVLQKTSNAMDHAAGANGNDLNSGHGMASPKPDESPKVSPTSVNKSSQHAAEADGGPKDELTGPQGTASSSEAIPGSLNSLPQSEDTGALAKESYIIGRMNEDIAEDEKKVVAYLIAEVDGVEVRHPVKTGINLIGRSPTQCDVCLPATGVSNVHAIIATEVSPDGAEHFLEDLDSTNGTTFGKTEYRIRPFRMYQLSQNKHCTFEPAKCRYWIDENAISSLATPSLATPSVVEGVMEAVLSLNGFPTASSKDHSYGSSGLHPAKPSQMSSITPTQLVTLSVAATQAIPSLSSVQAQDNDFHSPSAKVMASGGGLKAAAVAMLSRDESNSQKQTANGVVLVKPASLLSRLTKAQEEDAGLEGRRSRGKIESSDEDDRPPSSPSKGSGPNSDAISATIQNIPEEPKQDDDKPLVTKTHSSRGFLASESESEDDMDDGGNMELSRADMDVDKTVPAVEDAYPPTIPPTAQSNFPSTADDDDFSNLEPGASPELFGDKLDVDLGGDETDDEGAGLEHHGLGDVPTPEGASTDQVLPPDETASSFTVATPPLKSARSNRTVKSPASLKSNRSISDQKESTPPLISAPTHDTPAKTGKSISPPPFPDDADPDSSPPPVRSRSVRKPIQGLSMDESQEAYMRMDIDTSASSVPNSAAPSPSITPAPSQSVTSSPPVKSKPPAKRKRAAAEPKTSRKKRSPATPQPESTPDIEVREDAALLKAKDAMSTPGTPAPSSLEKQQRKHAKPALSKQPTINSSLSDVDETNSPTSAKDEKETRETCIMFTGIPEDDERREIVSALGGRIVDDWSQCTHLVTDKIRRTVKFLCALSAGKHIVNVRWLDACKKDKRFTGESKYFLKDARSEKQYGFSLKSSLLHAQKPNQSRLFEGLTFYATPSVKPPKEEMLQILQAAGGVMCEDTGTLDPENEKHVILGDAGDATEIKKLQKTGFKIYTNEFVLTGLLRMKVECDSHILGQDEAPVGVSAKKRRR